MDDNSPDIGAEPDQGPDSSMPVDSDGEHVGDEDDPSPTTPGSGVLASQEFAESPPPSATTSNENQDNSGDGHKRTTTEEPAESGDALDKTLEAATSQVQMVETEKPSDDESLINGLASEEAQRFETITSRFDDLERVVARFSDHIDKLHQENQSLRNAEWRRTLAPTMRALVDVLDTIDNLKASTDNEHEVAALDHVDSQLATALGAWGIEENTPNVEEAFDIREHQGVGAVGTTDPDLDRRIARIVRRGFSYEGLVLRRSEVQVFRVESNDSAATGSGD